MNIEQERAEFEAWLRVKPCGAAHDFGWEAWQARAALQSQERENALEAENVKLREALEVMVEMVEMNGFGRAYAMKVARAALAAQASGQDREDANMYWDADDPERFAATDLHGAVEYMMDGYTMSDLPMQLGLQCARRMPDIQVRVTAYSDAEGWQYEVIDAARKAKGEA